MSTLPARLDVHSRNQLSDLLTAAFRTLRLGLPVVLSKSLFNGEVFSTPHAFEFVVGHGLLLFNFLVPHHRGQRSGRRNSIALGGVDRTAVQEALHRSHFE